MLGKAQLEYRPILSSKGSSCKAHKKPSAQHTKAYVSSSVIEVQRSKCCLFTTKSAKSPEGNYIRIDNLGVRVAAHNLLPNSLSAVAEKEEAAGYAVDNLMQGVNACN